MFDISIRLKHELDCIVQFILLSLIKNESFIFFDTTFQIEIHYQIGKLISHITILCMQSYANTVVIFLVLV